MGSGQLLLTLGAMILLSFTIVNTNKSILLAGDVVNSTKYGVLASSLAVSIIEEASGKAFDTKSETMGIGNVANMTPYNLLGPETGETYATFDDFDDYNNLTKVDTTLTSARFTIKCKVYYVDDTAPATMVTTQTWHKTMEVLVFSQNMTDTIKMSTIFSYWYYR